MSLKNKWTIELEEGETATITFKCDACGNEQVFEVDQAWAETIACDCPEDIDEKGNVREYASLCVVYGGQE